MIDASAQMIAADLAAYGEGETARWIIHCSDDDLARVCSVASWIASNGPGTATSGMLLAKACALAAVYVREDAPRELTQSRRSRVVSDQFPGERRLPLFAEVPVDYGVGDDLRAFWD